MLPWLRRRAGKFSNYMKKITMDACMDSSLDLHMTPSHFKNHNSFCNFFLFLKTVVMVWHSGLKMET